MIFTEKYKPKKLKEVIGQGPALSALINTVKRKKPALIYGPIGCGKTSSVHSLASEFNFDVIELNGSDLRNKAKIKQIIASALLQKSLFFRPKLIFIDEIENLTRQDYGGIAEITSLLSIKNYPLILSANNPFDRKLSALRKKVELIQFRKLNTEEIMIALTRICKKENIQISQNILKKIALLSEGDLRAAINDLQGFEELAEKISGNRERETDIFSALKTIFKSNSFAVLNALNNLDMQTEEVLLWIDENLPLEYKKEELALAYEKLAKADIFNSRIKRHQHWRFLVYVNVLLTAGIAFSKIKKDERFVRYKTLTRLLKIWIANRSRKKEVAKKLGQALHCSSRKIFRELTYLKLICKDKKIRENLQQDLNLQKEETAFLFS